MPSSFRSEFVAAGEPFVATDDELILSCGADHGITPLVDQGSGRCWNSRASKVIGTLAVFTVIVFRGRPWVLTRERRCALS